MSLLLTLCTALLLTPLATSLPSPQTPHNLLKKHSIHRRDWEVQGQPCGQIFRWARADLDAGFYPVFPAYIVNNCLLTAPFNPAVALRFLDYLNTTLQFQSTLAYLANPPAGYQRPAIDVLSQLDVIRSKVVGGSYTREYDFEVDVTNVVNAIHDGHVDIDFGILAPFTFGSLWEIVSVSKDGVELPKPYLREDVTDAARDNWAWTPSAIETINGVDAVEYLKQFAANYSFGNVEAHADYNQLFEHPASDIQFDYGVWSGQVDVYPGLGNGDGNGVESDDWLDFVLENGTVVESEWWAELHYFQDPGPLETGGDLYNFFVLGLLPAGYNGTDDMVHPEAFGDSPEDKVTGSWWDETEGAYPRHPDVVQKDLSLKHGGVVTGYFLDDPLSTGVLSLPTFTQFGGEVMEFSDTVQEFIDKASGKGLEKVVIDLQQNTGGETKLAFDTFKRFFPKHDVFAGSRRRSHPLADVIGSAMTEWWTGLDEESDEYWEIAGNEWVVRPRIDAKTDKSFENWEDFDSGEAEYHGDRFSKVERYNLSDNAFVYGAFSGQGPYGFGRNPVVSEVEVFKPENIVLLTDGLCSSACSIFVEAMTRMGVRTLAVGGLPETGPMQAVSGSRGARAYTARSIDDIMAFVTSKVAAGLLPIIPPFSDTRDHGIRTSYLGINLRDQVRQDDPDQLPLQFRYEAADCRLFYTLANLYNLTRLWSDVATASFIDPSLCVANSRGYSSHPSNTSPLSPPTPPTSSSLSIPTGPSYSSDELANYTGPPPFDDGDLSSVLKIKVESEITPCSSQKPCDMGYSCQQVAIQCQPGMKPKRGMTEKGFCLPTCHSAKEADCRKYDSEQQRLGATFVCDAFGSVNSKAVSRGGKVDERDKFLGVCKCQSIKWPGTCA